MKVCVCVCWGWTMAEIFRPLWAKHAIPADGGSRPGFMVFFIFFLHPSFIHDTSGRKKHMQEITVQYKPRKAWLFFLPWRCLRQLYTNSSLARTQRDPKRSRVFLRVEKNLCIFKKINIRFITPVYKVVNSKCVHIQGMRPSQVSATGVL